MATAKKVNKAEQVRAYEVKHPNASAAEVAKACKTTATYVYAIRSSDKGKAAKAPKKWKMMHMSTSNEGMPFKEEAERIFELTKGRQRMHPKTGKMLMEGIARLEAANRFADAQHTTVESQDDNVNHPAHYKVGGIETIDFIEAKGLSYHLGNVVKYIARADSKGNRKEDLLKAQWYLNREIAKL